MQNISNNKGFIWGTSKQLDIEKFSFEVIHYVSFALKMSCAQPLSDFSVDLFLEVCERALNLKNIRRSIVPIFQWHILHVHSEIDFSFAKWIHTVCTMYSFGMCPGFQFIFSRQSYQRLFKKTERNKWKNVHTKIYYAICTIRKINEFYSIKCIQKNKLIAKLNILLVVTS